MCRAGLAKVPVDMAARRVGREAWPEEERQDRDQEDFPHDEKSWNARLERPQAARLSMRDHEREVAKVASQKG